MKKITLSFVLAGFAIAVCSQLGAEQALDYAQVNFCVPSKTTKTIHKEDLVTLVIDGPVLVYDSSPIPENQVIPFVNELLANKHALYIGVYIREGTKFGDVMRAVDLLRKTNTKNIGISVAQISAGSKV